MRKFVVGLLLFTCACAKEAPPTLGGEPVIFGNDPNAIVKTIDHPALFGVATSIDHGRTGLGVFQKGTGKPYLTLLDTDSDGVVDLLTYYVLDADGNELMSIEDFGMDGQADFKIDFVSDVVQVFYRGEWREGIRRDGSRGMDIRVGNDQVPLSTVLSELGRDDY